LSKLTTFIVKHLTTSNEQQATTSTAATAVQAEKTR